MTRDRDIERVLDRWFQEGSSAMPDRVLVATFDEVERTPQRRLIALLTRSFAMSPAIRISLAAAAVVAVVVAGMTFFRPAPGPAATPSPSPTATASASTPIPTALIGQWMGSPRVVSGIDPESGTSMHFTTSGFVFTASNRNNVEFLSSSASSLADDRFALRSTSATRGCDLGVVGTYTWSLSPGGRVMTVVAEGDACAVRGAAVPGTWWKMDCPTADDPCLGPLEAGTYASQFLDPFVAADGPWKARYAALTYTVPDGWTNFEDWPSYFGLNRNGDPEGAGVFLFSEVVAKATTEDCASVPDAGVGETAEAITTWLSTTEGLTTTDPEPVTLGGLSGWRLDVQMDPAWTQTCPFSSGQPTKGMFTDRDPAEGFDWGISAGGRMRLWVLDLGDGRTLVVDIEALAEDAYAALVNDATLVVQTFEFSR